MKKLNPYEIVGSVLIQLAAENRDVNTNFTEEEAEKLREHLGAAKLEAQKIKAIWSFSQIKEKDGVTREALSEGIEHIANAEKLAVASIRSN